MNSVISHLQSELETLEAQAAAEPQYRIRKQIYKIITELKLALQILRNYGN